MDITINLLPPKKKKELKKTKLRKTILKIGFSAILSVVALVVFVQFCVWFITIQTEAFDDRVEKFGEDGVYAQAKVAQDSLRKYSQTARRIKSKLNTQSNYWEIIDTVNNIIPENVYLKEISLEKQVLDIKGESLDRQALIVFQEELERSELFGEIESPISNFVASKDVNFEFIINLKSSEN